MSVVVECAGCGKRFKVSEENIGRRGRCSGCGAEVVAEAPRPEPAQSSVKLPRQMLANKAIAGRQCPVCSGAVELGQPVRNCELCGATHHEPCWAQHGGCATPLCGNSPLPAVAEPDPPPAPPAAATSVAGPATDKKRKPCPSCGEMIVVRASRCRFCGELLTGVGPRARAPARTPKARSGKNGLAVASMVCGICSIVVCILGFIVGPVAIGLAFGARSDMARRGSDPASQSMATIGLISGAVGTVIAVILMLAGLSSG